MPARPVLALLDGHSLAYRAFFALPEDLRTTTGQQTNAVYGFTSMLIKLLTEHRPDGIAVMFDKGRPAERLAILPEYKGNRRETPDAFRSQLPLIGEVLDALAIPQVTIDGVEADDLIATYATLASGSGMDTLVVTGDRDAFQLVDEHTSVLYTRRGISDTVVMDAGAIAAKYGVGPDRYPDLAALRGDPSDNIPGVPGVGEKTAAKLLAEYGDLEGIFANLEHIRGKRGEALAEHQQAVLDGYAVAQLRRDVEVPLSIDVLRRGDTDMEAVRSLFATLEFRALWERLAEALDAGVGDVEAGSFAVEPRRLGAGELVTWLGSVSPDLPVALVPFARGRPPVVAWDAVAVAAP
ncbi:MAG: 5'-3' exonuclease H3TH domain-containing protein, partial [Egibacteraceae bacterium]